MYRCFFKRFIDFIIGLIALPFVLLIVIIMAPIIYCNDPGPIFYNAKRLGKGGKFFKMYKFRSMYVNSPDIRNKDGSTFNGDSDPRVTKVGRFMRKTSIDEIPQLLNVLLGDMSLIGPRPTVSSQLLNLNDLDDIKRKHYMVRPGVTGYSQAYFRNSISQDEKFINDAYYVDNLSFALDVKILIQTVLSVLKKENIYIDKNVTQKSENRTVK